MFCVQNRKTPISVLLIQSKPVNGALSVARLKLLSVSYLFKPGNGAVQTNLSSCFTKNQALEVQVVSLSRVYFGTVDHHLYYLATKAKHLA
jgi:hypothetical protein